MSSIINIFGLNQCSGFFRLTGSSLIVLLLTGNLGPIAETVQKQSTETNVIKSSEATEDTNFKDCELHIWPSSGLRSVYHGWFHGGIVDGAVEGRDGYPTIPNDPMSTELQMKLLLEVDVAQSLNLPGYKTTVHETFLPNSVIRSKKLRLVDSPSPCYAELIVDDVFLQQDIVNGSFLKILYRLRVYGDGPYPSGTFGTWVTSELNDFPPDLPENTHKAMQELQAAYKDTTLTFGGYYLQSLKEKVN